MKLLEPLDINGMVIPNRTLVPAMVTRLSGEDGYVNQDIIDRYIRYAEGEIGLIVVEAMGIHTARSGPLLRIGEDRFNDGHRELTDRDAPGWGDDAGGLVVALRDGGGAELKWVRAPVGDIAGYDIYRADAEGEVVLVDAVKGARFVDKTILGGLAYTYYVRAFDATGRASPPSNSVHLAPPVPDYAATLEGESTDA